MINRMSQFFSLLLLVGTTIIISSSSTASQLHRTFLSNRQQRSIHVHPSSLFRSFLSTKKQIIIDRIPRGGALDIEEDDSDSDDEYDTESEDETESDDEDEVSEDMEEEVESDSEPEEEVEEEEEEVVDDDDEDIAVAADDDETIATDVEIKPYDEPLVASPLLNLYTSFMVMFLARKIDLFNPTIVRIVRFAFITYLISLQIFVFYVRIQAKRNNDRTIIELTNPISSVLQKQLGGNDDGNAITGMAKNLASSFLSSKTTIFEYDLKQARAMQSGIIFNMIFLWFLHFKMEQVQPVLIQTINGIFVLLYNPLFQVYVLGRNLERPFKNPALQRMEEAAAARKEQLLKEQRRQQQEEDTTTAVVAEEELDGVEKKNNMDTKNDEEDVSDEETESSDENKSDSDDDESEEE